MSNFITVSIAITLVLFSKLSLSEVPIPPKKQPDIELSVLGMTIGKSTLGDVKAKFKSKDFYHEGDESDGLDVLCFKSSNGVTIAFESGKMGGSEHKITSISINGPKKAYRLNSICEKNSVIKTKLALNGVSLGMSPELIKRLKGKPSKQETNFLLYQFEVHEIADKEQMDIVSSLEIEFYLDEVIALRASKMDSFQPVTNIIK